MVNCFKFIPFLLPLVTATPYKRFDNSTSVAPASSSDVYNTTSTTTVDAYTTVYLPSTTLVIPTSATSQLDFVSSYISKELLSTITSVITSYQTITSDDQVTSVPVTMTSVSVTKPSASVAANENDQCTPETITETTTETETKYVSGGDDDATTEAPDSISYSTLYLTSTMTTSYPITAEFTSDDLTTTITSFVDVTSTQTITTETPVPITSSSVAPTSYTGFNTTSAWNSTSF